jgi:hypothetical protein
MNSPVTLSSRKNFSCPSSIYSVPNRSQTADPSLAPVVPRWTATTSAIFLSELGDRGCQFNTIRQPTASLVERGASLLSARLVRLTQALPDVQYHIRFDPTSLIWHRVSGLSPPHEVRWQARCTARRIQRSLLMIWERLAHQDGWRL